eukprot:4188079-Amphidinium_carterae.1
MSALKPRLGMPSTQGTYTLPTNLWPKIWDNASAQMSRDDLQTKIKTSSNSTHTIQAPNLPCPRQRTRSENANHTCDVMSFRLQVLNIS